MFHQLHRPLAVVSGAMVALAVVCAFGLWLDDRVLVGAPIWLKPLKFAVSIVIYALTLAWMISLLDARRRRTGWWLGTVIAAGLIVEMIAIVGQLLRGRQSHFNVATAFDTAVWAVMAASIMIVFVATLGLGLVLLRQRLTDRPAALAIQLGIGIALAGMAIGFLMTFPTPSQVGALADGAAPTLIGAHGVGVEDGGPGLPVVGWSTAGGDLRVGHFIGLHALQALPLLAFALTPLSRRRPLLADPAVRTRLIATAGVGYAWLTGVVTWQALRGQPVTAPDALTLAVAALGLLTTLTAATWAVRSHACDAALPVAGGVR
ncbi:hypothetical protein [Catenuloplanes atrovinosus]|uniref:Uncharacterized protein n=1 Tax=Catenuloplanes atrovinosus TaxID=137266 RepID=A0AAE4CDW3_9ACTN|nr:hypothetical protein [Catenuloplanes atrovinosus]MDR7281051.1 hypothetical protein [Catenuloplanes atrovinosus]